MAKSIRSKSCRRLRNVTRKHFAKKELERLYKCVKTGQEELIKTVKWRSEKKEEEAASISNPDTIEDSATMDVDKTAAVYDKKTKRDENGHYPPWMNQRSIKKHKKKLAARRNKGKSIKW